MYNYWKTLFWKVQCITIGKLASYFQMNVCQILARSVMPRHEHIGDKWTSADAFRRCTLQHLRVITNDV